MTSDTDRPSLKHPTKRDLIVSELRAMIASGRLRRGARVPQDDLAARFNTSITPVREALRQLEAEGLLVSEPHRGVRVSETNIEDARGVFVARRLLEPFAAQLATLRVSRRDIAQARDLNTVMKEALEAGDPVAVRDANRAFHFLIYEKSDIPSLLSVIEGLWLSFPWDILDVLDARATRSIDEHAHVLTKLEEGDVGAVGASIERHIERSYRALVKHLTGAEPTDDPFDEIRRETQAN